MSAPGAASAKPLNVPASPISLAIRINPPQADRASAPLTKATCAAAYNPDSVANVVSQFQAWRAGKPVPGLVETSTSAHTVRVNRGCTSAIRLLKQIALAHVALGKASPDIIPMYRPLGHFGDIALVQPTCDWYDVDLPEP